MSSITPYSSAITLSPPQLPPTPNQKARVKRIHPEKDRLGNNDRYASVTIVKIFENKGIAEGFKTLFQGSDWEQPPVTAFGKLADAVGGKIVAAVKWLNTWRYIPSDVGELIQDNENRPINEHEQLVETVKPIPHGVQEFTINTPLMEQASKVLVAWNVTVVEKNKTSTQPFEWLLANQMVHRCVQNMMDDYFQGMADLLQYRILVETAIKSNVTKCNVLTANESKWNFNITLVSENPLPNDFFTLFFQPFGNCDFPILQNAQFSHCAFSAQKHASAEHYYGVLSICGSFAAVAMICAATLYRKRKKH